MGPKPLGPTMLRICMASGEELTSVSLEDLHGLRFRVSVRITHCGFKTLNTNSEGSG